MLFLSHIFLATEGSGTFVPNWLIRILQAALIAGLAFLIMKILQWVFTKLAGGMKEKAGKKFKTLQSLLFSTLRALIIFFAVVFILDLFGVNTASVIAAAGIGGVAFAFGAQKVIADLFSGIFILLDESFQIGDYITLPGGISGTVVNLNLRRTTIRDYSGALHLIPNSEIGAITNYQQKEVRCDVTVEVPYTVSPEVVKEVITEVSEQAQEQEDLFAEIPFFLGIDQANPFTYTVTVSASSPTGQQWAGARWLRESLIQGLTDKGAYLEGIGNKDTTPASSGRKAKVKSKGVEDTAANPPLEGDKGKSKGKKTSQDE